MRLATQAIAYASLTKFGHNSAHKSRNKYVQAIRAVEKAIRNPIELKSDLTLYAVLLLGGYEVSFRKLPEPSVLNYADCRSEDDYV